MAEAILGPPLARGQVHDTALVCGDDAVTYEQLAERVNRAGNVLRESGVAQGDRVLLMARDTPAYVYAYLGALKIGAPPVGLNLRLSADDLAFTIEDSGCKVLCLDSMFLDLYRSIEDRLEAPPKVILTNERVDDLPLLACLMAEASAELEPVELSAADPGFWMYSSGTTGKPKGVVHSVRTVFAASRYIGDVLGVGRGDRVFCSSKLFFAFSLGHCLFGSLQLGATVILYPDWPDAEAVADLVERFRPTVMLSVPTFYRNLVRDGVAGNEAFRNVRHYMSAGENLPASLFDRWMEATGRPILDGIGATETCFLFLANRPEDYRRGRTGKETPGTKVKLMSEGGDLIEEPDTPGILWVKMDSVAQGYWKMGDRSRAVFRDGWYCTNDVFVRDADGWYEYRGRGDDMLKVSGQWVSPTEIEEHVLTNPKVSEAAVVGVANEDGLIRLALFMVAPEADGDREALEAELRNHLTANLSVYKCPRRMFFVDSMPLTATGKLQRYQLREIAEAAEGGG